jgi:hypothetical protein
MGGIASTSGPLVVAGSGSYGITFKYELQACGWVDSGGGATLDGLFGDGGALSMPFCVQGSTLWLLPNKEVGSSTLRALKFTK